MENTIKLFTGERLFKACESLMQTLSIGLSKQTEQALPASSVFKGVQTNALGDALQFIKDIYYVGSITDDTIAHKESSASVDDEAEKSDEQRYKTMIVFAMDVNEGVTMTRSNIAVLTRSLNKRFKAMPIILLLRERNSKGCFLSLATCERGEYTQAWRQGEKLGKVAILRNINCKHPHRGHLDILDGLKASDCNTFDKLYEKWMKVFNSEVLTKKFYNELFEWYQWAIKPETNVTFPGDADTPDDDREDIDTRIIRLITRLMFVWFIKQKELVPNKIFDVEQLKGILKNFDPQSSTDSNYYQAILQNLFFGTLNRAILEDGEVRGFAKASKIDVRNLYRYEELFAISEQEVIDMFATVPYLNCGLFECQDKCKSLDGVERRFYNDGFSRNAAKFANGTYRYRAVVPNVLFFHPEKGILSIFNRYVFTIEENTPQDVQVALDPELLGKVFENLLGAYNPETKETARNQSGSFYTPREIVQYMVNESLVAHLKRTVGEELETQYRQLMDFSDNEVSLTDNQKEAILHSLFTCKILDPACGSGAFPMGMLQQMVHILQQVDPDNTQWKDILLNMATDESRRAFGIESEEERKKKLLEIEETFNDGLNSPDYTRKLYIIESCIYGVDIQPIAMLITRLRFFISLICEQKDIRRDDPEHNFGIKTLPNLESKFVAANSLINADIHKYNQDWTNNRELALLKEELLAIRRRHFYTRKRNEKMRLLKEDEKKREQIHKLINVLVGEPNEDKIAEYKQSIAKYEAELLLYAGEDWVDETVQTDLFGDAKVIRVDRNKRNRDALNAAIKKCKADIEHEYHKTTPHGFEAAVLQVTDWNPYDQSKVSPFLDIEWMFGMTDGFDIVIGNPPYIQLQMNGGELAKLYKDCGFETYEKSGDIYCLFYERGYQLLKDNSHLCYITSNKWMRTGYGNKMRGFFSTKTNPILLVDFSGIKIFESATVDTNILIFSKSVNLYHTVCCSALKMNNSSLYDFVTANHTLEEFKNSNSWVILSESASCIKHKVEIAGKKLKEWDIDIVRGVLTGNNDAFFITSNQRQTILNNCCTENERITTDYIIRKLIRGRNIKKYSVDWDGKWLIGTYPSKNYDINELPSIKNHLEHFAVSILQKKKVDWIWQNDNFLKDYCVQKLTQKGKDIIIDGQMIYIDKKVEHSRKKTQNEWYEIQDSIAYWRNFDLPKIIYPNMTKYMPFYYDEERYVGNDKSFIITGVHISFLTAFFNSSLFKFCFRDNFPELLGGTRELRKIFFDKIPVMEVDDATDEEFRELVLDIQKEYSDEKAKAIDQKIFDLYGLTQEERDMVGYIDFHNNGEEDDDE